jgi:hypothetical protein
MTWKTGRKQLDPRGALRLEDAELIAVLPQTPSPAAERRHQVSAARSTRPTGLPFGAVKWLRGWALAQTAPRRDPLRKGEATANPLDGTAIDRAQVDGLRGVGTMGSDGRR